MNQVKYVPIDLPRDASRIIDTMSDELKKTFHDITEKALAEDRWSEPEDMVFDPSNLEFGAYWLYKSKKPLVKALRGSGLEEYFEKSKKKSEAWTPDSFKADKVYKMSASGDLMSAKYIEESKDRLYSNVEELIFGVDYSYANLESTLSIDAPKGFSVEKQGDTPHINITKAQYDVLVKHGNRKYNALQIANNHIMDCGEKGARLTMEQLKKDDIAYLGVYESEAEANSVAYSMLDGIKIGWIAHTFSLNSSSLPEDKPWFCDVTPFHLQKDPDTTKIEKQIQNARDEGCDLVFVALHWGLEHEFYPHPDQLKWAHKFAELGADAIIGHHPHVCQPYELYQPENDPIKRIPIIYSLGNLTPLSGSSASVLSLVANLSISKGQLNGRSKTFITGIEMTPIAFMSQVENDQNFASLIPLRELNAIELDAETRAYVDEINGYADLVLSKSWRE
jgi:poly-gamma-glutamate synthesis protein (capsule biosynthesis protein)